MQISMFKYFLTVAETGSIRQASLSLHVSASAISRQIQNLEHSFQTTLFDRCADGMLLTEEGRVLALHMQRTMREMELARAKNSRYTRIDGRHGEVCHYRRRCQGLAVPCHCRVSKSPSTRRIQRAYFRGRGRLPNP